MKTIPAINLALLFLGGCGRGDTANQPQAANTEAHSPVGSTPLASDDDAIKSAVASYATAPLDQRFKYVVDGDTTKEAMAKFYRHEVNDIATVRVDGITFVNDLEAVADTTVSINDGKGLSNVAVPEYLRKRGGRWLIDWQANVGMNPMRLSVFLATRPSDRLTMRVDAELSSFGPVGIPKDAIYSFRLSDIYGDVGVSGYVSRQSPAGKKLFNLFKDGGSRKITVVIERVGGNGVNSDDVVIDDLVSATWFIDKPTDP